MGFTGVICETSKYYVAWWRHQMETFSKLLALVRGIDRSPVNSPHKGPVTRSFDIFFDLRLNKRLSKQSWGWYFETPSCSLWRHCHGIEHCFSACLWTHIKIIKHSQLLCNNKVSVDCLLCVILYIDMRVVASQITDNSTIYSQHLITYMQYITYLICFPHIFHPNVIGIVDFFTLNVRHSCCAWQKGPTPWLLMPWRHRESWYWSCRPQGSDWDTSEWIS